MTSIRAALLLSITGGATLVVLLAGAATYFLAGDSLRRQSDEALAARARHFATLVIDEQPDPDEGDEGGLTLDYKGSLQEADLGVLLHIAALGGPTLAQSPVWPTALAAPAADGEEPTSFATVHLPDGRSARLITIVAFAGAEPEVNDEAEEADEDDDTLLPSDHRIVVRMLASDAPLRAARQAVLSAVVIGALATAAGAALIVSLAVSRGLRPLHGLASQLRAMPAGNLHPLHRPAPEPAEIAPIADALDDLLRRVGAAVERERRFTDAAAHELRTPLAELRTLSDVAARFPEPDRLTRAAQEAGAIGREMSDLVEALLLASRARSPDAETPTPLAVAPLVESSIRGRRDHLDERNIRLSADLAPAASWRTLPGAAAMIVRNLVNNAADYTPPGGAIDIQLYEKGARLEVRNGPTSLTPEEVARMFEPFWRADASRTDRAHRGLGLAIVAAQCEAAGLRCGARLTDDHELLVFVESPSA